MDDKARSAGDASPAGSQAGSDHEAPDPTSDGEAPSVPC